MKNRTLLPFLAATTGLVLAASPPARAANTILHNFTGGAGDGSEPYGSLTLSGTTLYGMTREGGSGSGGTIFRMNADGSGFSLLHSFTAGYGTAPYGSLTLSGTTLYGMTREGSSSGAGTVFRMNTDGSGFSLLHSFTGGAADGRLPFGSLTLSGSTLYGMTSQGGSNDNGTLFRMNTDGSDFSLLHSFTGLLGDGRNPLGSLTLSGSTFYGMTSIGGSGSGGTIFRINADGSGFSTLHSFTGGPAGGAQPYGSLTLSGTILYGMASYGGTGNGTLFVMNVDNGFFGVVNYFDGAPADGANPLYGDLTLSADGSTLYGMTSKGGSADLGVVFSHPVPEPASAALLGLGTLLLAARHRATAQRAGRVLFSFPD